jgi:O-antigen polymerase
MHIPLYNLGGSGLTLPQNVLTWIIVGVFFSVFFCVINKKKIVITSFLICLIMGGGLMTLPVLWHNDAILYHNASTRFLGLWTGILLFSCIIQLDITEKFRKIILWMMVLSTLVEGIRVIQTIFFSHSLDSITARFFKDCGRNSLGVFQQVNVTASWLATGLSAMMVLVFSDNPASYILGGDSTKRENNYISYVGLFFTSAIMVILTCCIILTKSRVGWLGASVCYLLIIVRLFLIRENDERTNSNFLNLVLSPAIGVFIGLSLLDCSPTHAIAHEGSNVQRILTLKETWNMIMLHPFKGWGPGTFKNEFQNHMSNFALNPSRELMGHPHNEILYVWFEGGIIAFIGFIIILYGIVGLLLSQTNKNRLMLGITLIPILLHTQTEFPLYISAPHFIIIILLLSLVDGGGKKTRFEFMIFGEGVIWLKFIRCVAIISSVLISLWLCFILKVGFLLSSFEDGTLKNMDGISQVKPSFLVKDRYTHDLNLLELTHYYDTSDVNYLMNYANINGKWLINHPEPDDYDNQIKVLISINKHAQAEFFHKRAQKLFPWDARFQ